MEIVSASQLLSINNFKSEKITLKQPMLIYYAYEIS